MELMLGLALPTHNPIDGFNLNNPALPKSDHIGANESKKLVKIKRSFEESFEHSLKTLPLFVWSGQPNEEDDDRGGKMHKIHTSNKNEEEENNLVGWPPIKSWRKKKFNQGLHPSALGQNRRNNRVLHAKENQSRGENSNTLYVKVHMEGVAIGRKIDLKLYDSYHTLTNSLVNMFGKYQNLEDDDHGGSYTLNFQNEQGDWLPARHVPWQSFIGSVQRLVILREEKM